MRAILGVAAPDVDAERAVATNLVAVTPSLRALLLFLDRDASSAGVGFDDIPRLLSALHTFALLAASAGMQQVTYQTLMRLLRDYRYLLEFLASVDRVFTWKEDALIDMSAETGGAFREGYLGIVHALAPASQRRRRMTLGAILRNTLTAKGSSGCYS